jgi:NADH-quinone oxidoreductase subunit L
MDKLFAVQYAWLIPLLPLLGAAVSGFLGARWLKRRSHWPIWITVGASAVLSLSLLFGMLRIPADETTRPGEEHLSIQEINARREAASLSGESRSFPRARPVKWFSWFVAGGSDEVYKSYAHDDIRHADGTANPLPSLYVEAGAWLDPLTAVMLCVVCGIGFFITVFAAGYMKGEEGYFRFFAYLGLFIFSMTCLVMANNLVMLFLGWEGVGLCSYLLIGYYYERPAAREAAKKAFLVNRIGDFGFTLGIMLTFLAFGTVSFYGRGANTSSGVLDLAAVAQVTGQLTDFQRQALNWIPFLLMLGAFGKSAQFPLYVWLPDAMEGPTPVSALIHAATMVTAGVYMIARCGTLFVNNTAAMITIAAVGAFTALFAATIALRQFDLKKVFAYSTISQLGFMFVGVGVLAPVAGIFHLVTHAFFKALLFLSSGVVMHAMLGHLDMRKMSGLKRVMPKTRILMLIGCLALAGFPFFSGFFSKDEIVHHAWEYNKLLGGVMLLTAFLTAYYTFRLYFRVFEGPLVVPTEPAEGQHTQGDGHDSADPHAHASAAAVETGDTAKSGVDEHLATAEHQHDQAGADSNGHGHNHEPAIMIVPLIVLAIGAVVAGYLNWPPPHDHLGHFLLGSPSISGSYVLSSSMPGAEVEPSGFGVEIQGEEPRPFSLIMLASALIAFLGILLAYQFHLEDRLKGNQLPAKFPELSKALESKYWVDEIYQAAIVEPLRTLGRAFFLIDQMVVDGVVWLLGFIPQASGFALKITTQRGYLQGYAAAMLFGIAIILLLVFL